MAVSGGRTILVGIDGSFAAERAARWAAREAAARHVGLELVFVYDWAGPVEGHWVAARFRDGMVGWARDCLRQAADGARLAAPEVPIDTDLAAGHPIEVLTRRSAEVELIALGSRGLGGLVGLVAGSVAVGVVSHAACPVVVVPCDEPGEAAREYEPRASGPVVVGVDASAGCADAVSFAFDYAALHHEPLVAVRAWHDAVLLVEPAVQLDRASLRGAEERLLAEQLAGWQEKYPDVAVRRSVELDRPAAALLEHGREARLLVVGARGRGGMVGLLLGSTSQALLHRAECPVAVVRGRG